jgi:EmrB/QacA subfamily drug resistance transporter
MPRSATLNRPLALIAAAGFAMENLDGTIIQTAAPAMARHFGVQAVDLNVAMTAYLLTVAVCVPVSGWLAERFGDRRVFTTAVAIFTVASVLCAVSPDLTVLTAARVLQGVGGAMMVPVGRLAVLRNLDRRDLLDAMAYLTWPALVAPVVAPAIGGILTDTVGWPWIFLINVPFGIAMVIAAPRIVPGREYSPNGIHESRPFDWAGFSLVGLALATLVLGMEEISEAGSIVWAVGYLAVAAVAGATGVLWMRRARHPLLDFSSLRIATFRATNVGGGVYRMIISAAPFLFTLLFQVGFGWSAVRAGLMVGFVFVGNIAIKPATSPLIRRFGFKTVIVGSNLIGALLYVACVFLAPSTPLWMTAILLLFTGVFRSIGFTAYNSLQFVEVPPALTTQANTLASTMQQVATGIGVAVAALIVRITTGLAGWLTPGDAQLGYRWAFLAVALLLVVPLIESMLLHRQAGQAAARREAP